jgi:hypothetical protein
MRLRHGRGGHRGPRSRSNREPHAAFHRLRRCEERGVVIFQSPEQRAQIRALQRDLCRAILDGDADVARLMMRRRSSVIAEWLDRAASA